MVVQMNPSLVAGFINSLLVLTSHSLMSTLRMLLRDLKNLFSHSVEHLQRRQLISLTCKTCVFSYLSQLRRYLYWVSQTLRVYLKGEIDRICRYGPFWICTTLIFVAASIGTFVTYIAHKWKKQEWNYDINLVTWSAGVFYGYVTIVPLALYVVLKYFSAPSGLVQLFCLYGYSLFVFIPALVPNLS